MAKVIINSENYNFEELLDRRVVSAQIFEGGLIIERLDPLSANLKFVRIYLDGDAGGIIVQHSSDGENWTDFSNHANSTLFGAVKPNDSYTATGTAADGLVPSQKALSDALAVRNLTSGVTADTGVDNVSVRQNGRVVEVHCRVKGGNNPSNILTGLPAPAFTGTGRYINGYGTSADYAPVKCVAQLTSAGVLQGLYSESTTEARYYWFTYIAANIVS